MSRTHWRSCVRSKMQAQEFLSHFYCSEESRQGLDNQIICLSVINILLGITAIFGNTVILIALCKETSLHKPFKVLLRNLVVSDLWVGFVQLLFGGHHQCLTLVFQVRCMDSIPWDEHCSLFNYIHVLLHQGFFQAAPAANSSPY